MPNHLLIDNWTLQCTGQLLADGLQGEDASELVVKEDLSGFSYRTLSGDAVNTRCLFQTLNHVVFADELFVDADFKGSWDDVEALAPLVEKQLVVPKPFQDIRHEWLPARQRFIDELCVCEEMRELHERNVILYGETQENEDPFFSQLIWGGAGMLARAHALGIPYSGHPLRESWFSHVDSLFGRRSAQHRLGEFVSGQRVKIFNRIDTGGYLVRLNLPPVAALAVQEARQPEDLLPVALQLRDEYAPLRRWLGEFQQALDQDNTADLLAREKLLQSVARHIDARCSAFPVGDTTVQIGLSWLKVTAKGGSPGNSLLNQLGVRASLNRLVLAPTGGSVLSKLGKLFGEEHSSLGIALARDYPGQNPDRS